MISIYMINQIVKPLLNLRVLPYGDESYTINPHVSLFGNNHLPSLSVA